MTEDNETIQFTMYIPKGQDRGLKRITQRNGIGRQSLIRLAIDAFLLANDPTYRTEQSIEQPVEQAA